MKTLTGLQLPITATIQYHTLATYCLVYLFYVCRVK
nr:MAG TPA: hypothetical protein [Siphoviridae sp. ctcBx5]